MRAWPVLPAPPLLKHLGEQALHFVWAAHQNCGMGEEKPAPDGMRKGELALPLVGAVLESWGSAGELALVSMAQESW